MPRKANNYLKIFGPRGCPSILMELVGFRKQTARTHRTKMWRKRNEGLKQECSAKDKNKVTAGRMVKCFVAIASGKGVLGCHQYEDNVNGEMFSKLVREHFPELFQR